MFFKAAFNAAVQNYLRDVGADCQEVVRVTNEINGNHSAPYETYYIVYRDSAGETKTFIKTRTSFTTFMNLLDNVI